MRTIATKLKMTQIFKEDRAIGVTPLRILIDDRMTEFKVGDAVSVSATSKGKGFQGVVKRHGFHGGPKTHGQKNRYRAPGSIGNTSPQRVIPGRRMAGRMGGVRVTIKNLKVVAVDPEQNILSVEGATPGTTNARVEIKKAA